MSQKGCRITERKFIEATRVLKLSCHKDALEHLRHLDYVHTVTFPSISIFAVFIWIALAPCLHEKNH